jgi:septal ring factor EnvC (AmiA/AmiB activator)
MSEQRDNAKPEQQALDEDITIYEQTLSIERSQQKSRRVFVFYIIGLFCVALCLILLSYVMQQHANTQLEALGSQLTEQTDAAAGAEARADQLQEALDSLQQQLDTLQSEKDAVDAKVSEQEKSIAALEQLCKLEQLVYNEELEQAAVLITQMDSAYTREVLSDTTKAPLTGEAAEEYAALCEQVEE